MYTRLRLLPLSLTLLGLIGGLAVLDHGIRRFLIMPSFTHLENRLAARDMIRCREAIRREAFHLGRLTTDWAEWDDTYRFVVDRNEAYIDSNLQMETLLEVGINLLFIIAADGQIIVDEIFDPESRTTITLPEMSARLFPAEHPLLRSDAVQAEHVDGLMLTSKGPMLIAAHPILTSEAAGPARGTLVMGRFLTDAIIADLNRQTQIPFSIKTRESPALSIPERRLLAGSAEDTDLSMAAESDRLHALTALPDIDGRPALLIHAVLERDVYRQGRRTAAFVSLTVLSAVLLLIVTAVSLFFHYRAKVGSHRRSIEALVSARTAELSATDARLKALTEAASEGIMLFEDGLCRGANTRAREMFGIAGTEPVDVHITDLVVPEQRAMVQGLIGSERDRPVEVTGLRRDGSIFPLAVHAKTVRSGDRVVRTALFHDLSDKKRLEETQKNLEKRLKRSERMESIGLLAGGVAHDLNNILSGIVTYPELILLGLPGDSEFRRPLEAIQKAGRRAAEVVADLLTVARGIAMVMEPVDINTIVRDYLVSPEFAALARHYPDVTVSTGLAPDIPPLLGSTIHIAKCLMNLVTNGAEAIKTEGQITIATESVDFTPEQAMELGLAAGPYTVLAVSDTGPGIAARDLAHIFEPFYSRKIAGRSGTGLGLAVVWNTMQDHRGTVLVSSSERGSVFKMYFPVTSEAVRPPHDEERLEELRGRRESILIVDDDPQQREIAAQLLAELNYTPTTADSGETALAVLRSGSVDLVILDMVMEPGMSGLATYTAILELYPGQKALIASGFSDTDEVQKACALGAASFIRKPYSVARMGRAIRQALTQRPD